MNKASLATALRSHYPKAFGIRKALAAKKRDSYRSGRRPFEEVIETERTGTKEEFVFSYWDGAKSAAKIDQQIEDVLARAPQYQVRDDLDAVRTDMRFAYLAYGFLPDEYLCYDLEGKPYEERSSYISDSDRYEIVYGVNDIAVMQTLLNKVRTFQALQPFYRRDGLVVRGAKDAEALAEFVAKHPEFVLKNPCASRGAGVSLVSLDSSNQQAVQDAAKRFTKDGVCLVEERITQNAQVARLNGSSVNTVRCITLDDGSGPKVAFTFAKAGRAGSFVDNGGAGGILFGIDPETGVGNTQGIDELNITYLVHPDSGVAFEGFEFPQWEQMLSLCLEMSSRFPELPYIGWDVACSEDGWVLVEGNMGQFIGPQTTAKKGMKAYVQHMLGRRLFD